MKIISQLSNHLVLSQYLRKPKSLTFKAFFIFAIISFFLFGCTKKPVYISFDETALIKMQLSVVCSDYYILKQNKQLTPEAQDQLEKHLLKRGITQGEILAIQRNDVFVGMSFYALLASWGRPISVNKTVTGTFEHEQLCYGTSGRYGIRNYRAFVYTEYGKITSIQTMR